MSQLVTFTEITPDTVVMAIAVGDVTLSQLAREFGVPTTDVALLCVLAGLFGRHAITVDVSDSHAYALAGGRR